MDDSGILRHGIFIENVIVLMASYKLLATNYNFVKLQSTQSLL